MYDFVIYIYNSVFTPINCLIAVHIHSHTITSENPTIMFTSSQMPLEGTTTAGKVTERGRESACVCACERERRGGGIKRKEWLGGGDVHSETVKTFLCCYQVAFYSFTAVPSATTFIKLTPHSLSFCLLFHPLILFTLLHRQKEWKTLHTHLQLLVPP